MTFTLVKVVKISITTIRFKITLLKIEPCLPGAEISVPHRAMFLTGRQYSTLEKNTYWLQFSEQIATVPQ